MNRTFKVVFSKARGALMVANELTSSVQAKGTKTVVAAAVAALAAGAVCAADAAWQPVPENAVTKAHEAVDGTWTFTDDAYSFVSTESENAFIAATADLTFDKSLWVKTVNDNKAQATGFWAAAGATVTNKGTIYVTTDNDDYYYKSHAMGVTGSGKIVNDGTIVLRNGYGLYAGSTDIGSEPVEATIENNGTIAIEGIGAGIELGGTNTKATATNNGTITGGYDLAGVVPTDKKAVMGVLINKAGQEFINGEQGVIDVKAGDYQYAVKVEAADAQITLKKGSTVKGVVSVENTGTKINAAGDYDDMMLSVKSNAKADVTATDTLALGQVEVGEDGALTFANAVTVTRSMNNSGTVTSSDDINIAQGATLQNGGLMKTNTLTVAGTVNTGMFIGAPSELTNHIKFETLTLDDGGVFNITDKPSGLAENTFTFTDGTINLKGGQFYDNGTLVGADYTLEAGEQATINLSAGNYTYGTIALAGKAVQTGGKLTVTTSLAGSGNMSLSGGTFALGKDATVTASNLTMTGGTVEAWGAQLFKAAETEETSYSLNTLGTALNTSGNKGYLSIQDALELSTDDIQAINGLFSTAKGLNITFANLTLTDATTPDISSDLGTALINQTGNAQQEEGATTATVTVGTSEGDRDVGVGAIGVQAGTTALTVSGEGKLIIGGLGDNVIQGVDEVESMTVAGTLELGQSADSTGTVNAKSMAVKALNVVGNFKAQDVTVTDESTISEGASLDLNKMTVGSAGMTVEGTLAATSLAGSGTYSVAGTVALNEGGTLDEDSTVTLTDGGMLVLGNGATVSGTVTVSTGDLGVTVFALTETGTQGLESMTFVTTNQNVKSILASSFLTDANLADKTGVVYLDKSFTIDTTGSVAVGGATATADQSGDRLILLLG